MQLKLKNFRDFIPLHYEQVLWSSSFRLLEEAVSLDDNNKMNFLTVRNYLFYFKL